MICKNLKELEKELYKRINIALDTDVTDIVKDVMTDHIIQDVYEAYEPTVYQRRYTNGGLLDPDNIIATLGNNGEMLVQNVAMGNEYYYIPSIKRSFRSANADKFISPIIEYGIDYDVVGVFPRPFMQNTHDDLEQNHYHTQAMKQSLKKQGLEVK